MSRHILLVTAGNGPAECNQAVAGVLGRMAQEAQALDLSLDTDVEEGVHGPKSALVLVEGHAAKAFAQAWCGTIRWRMKSHLRKTHKRANWFVGVFELAPPDNGHGFDVTDVTFQTFRAGGPGGQHQNTTDSAVRATHLPTGLSVAVREGRSQHRNKSLALERLEALLLARAAALAQHDKSRRHSLSHQVERGNPVRRFIGPSFEEDTET